MQDGLDRLPCLPWRPWLTTALHVCVSILQATRNGNDLWLSHWVSQATPPPAGSSSLAATAAAALWRSQGGDSGMPQGLPAPLPAMLGCAALGSADKLRASPDSGASAHLDGGGLDTEVRYYLAVLLAIAAANSLATLARAFLFAKGGLVAAQARLILDLSDGCRHCVIMHGSKLSTPPRPLLMQRIHERLLAAVLALPLAFFDATPSGRVLNRFSSDTGVTFYTAWSYSADTLLCHIVRPLPLPVLALLCPSLQPPWMTPCPSSSTSCWPIAPAWRGWGWCCASHRWGTRDGSCPGCAMQ